MIRMMTMAAVIAAIAPLTAALPASGLGAVEGYSAPSHPALGQLAAEKNLEFLTTCPFAKGDTLASVKKFYRIASAPRKWENPTPEGTAFDYHFPQYGVWVFFDDKLLIKGLRFDAPFQGRVDGIGIGDSADHLRSVKGEPALRFPGLPTSLVASEDLTAWVYDPGSSRFARYDVNPADHRVQTIFVDTCSSGLGLIPVKATSGPSPMAVG
jgi:hypothetical protein